MIVYAALAGEYSREKPARCSTELLSQCLLRLGSVSSSANADWPRQLAGASNDTQRRRVVLPSPRPLSLSTPSHCIFSRQLLPPLSPLVPFPPNCSIPSPRRLSKPHMFHGAPSSDRFSSSFFAYRPTRSFFFLPSSLSFYLSSLLSLCHVFFFSFFYFSSTSLSLCLLSFLLSWQAATRPIYALFLGSFPSDHNFDCTAIDKCRSPAYMYIFIIHHQLLETGLTDSIIGSFFFVPFPSDSALFLLLFRMTRILRYRRTHSTRRFYPFDGVYPLVSQPIFSSRYFSFSFPKCASAFFSAYTYTHTYTRERWRKRSTAIIRRRNLTVESEGFRYFPIYRFLFRRISPSRFMSRYATYIIRRRRRLLGSIRFINRKLNRCVVCHYVYLARAHFPALLIIDRSRAARRTVTNRRRHREIENSASFSVSYINIAAIPLRDISLRVSCRHSNIRRRSHKND